MVFRPLSRQNLCQANHTGAGYVDLPASVDHSDSGAAAISSKGYTRERVSAENFRALDWTNSDYIGPLFLYMSYGVYDAAWQTFAYWAMGSLTNDARKLANFAGFYKGIQSAGAAVAWRLDNLGTPYMNMLALCWALLGGSLIIALPVVLFKIKNHVTAEDELQISDENS